MTIPKMANVLLMRRRRFEARGCAAAMLSPSARRPFSLATGAAPAQSRFPGPGPCLSRGDPPPCMKGHANNSTSKVVIIHLRMRGPRPCSPVVTPRSILAVGKRPPADAGARALRFRRMAHTRPARPRTRHPYQKGVAMPAAETALPFKVADLGAAEFGRKEIVLAEHEMPGLMAMRSEYAERQPLVG